MVFSNGAVLSYKLLATHFIHTLHLLYFYVVQVLLYKATTLMGYIGIFLRVLRGVVPFAIRLHGHATLYSCFWQLKIHFCWAVVMATLFHLILAILVALCCTVVAL